MAFSGPRPDWDPDIVAALDEDFDFDDPDNQLADDFMIEANDGNEPIAVQGEQSGRYYDSDSEKFLYLTLHLITLFIIYF